MMMMMMLIMPKWVPYVSPRKTEPHFGGNKWLKSTKTAGNIKRWSRGGKTNQFFIQCAPIKKGQKALTEERKFMNHKTEWNDA